MEIELVAIGDEIVNGYTVNTNGSFLASQLLMEGFSPSMHSAIGDEPHLLERFLSDRLQQGAILITSGGLGPTCDDWTRKVAAKIFDVPLEPRQELVTRLKSLFGDFSTLSDQLVQPRGAKLLENDLGTASGFVLRDENRFPGAMLIALPGVPSEMQQMVKKQVIPFLKREFQLKKRLWTKLYHFFSLIEADIDPTLREIQERFPAVQCSIYPHFSTVTVHLTVEAGSQEDADMLVSAAQKLLLDRFGQYTYHSETGHFDEAVHRLLVAKKITLATAESCTGGALAASFVAYPEASTYFQGSVVAYSNAVKQQVLGVEKQVLEAYGAVSEQVTAQMASGVRQMMSTECAIAVSGIFGPAGGTEKKPVGTVCVSLLFKDQPMQSWTMKLSGNRQTIAERCIQRIFVELYKKIVVPESSL